MSGSMKALIFILCAIALVLLLALLMREQTVKSLKDEKGALKKLNVELQQTFDDGQKMSLAQRLGTAGIDTLNLWKFETEGCEIPFCFATRIGVDGVEDFAEQFRGLNRWKGYVTELKEVQDGPEDLEGQDGSHEKTSSCEAFAIEGGADFPINMDLLADVEKKLLKAGNEKNQVEITVYSIVTEGEPISCNTPAYVVNVNL